MDKKVKVGIIGIGNMGTGHAKSIYTGKCPELEVTAVADTNPDRINWAKEFFEGKVICYNNGDELINSGKVEAVIIAVPHYFHTEFAIKCLKKGLHVMVEKPAGVYTNQVKLMNTEAEKHPELVFGMMFNQRTNHVYRKMRELIKSGEFGEIRRTNWIITNWYRPQAYYDSGEWRATWSGEGGGVLLNQCPHQLDLWQWICGMPVKVHSKLHYGKWHNIEVEDDVSTYVEYPNGATGIFITTTGDAHGTNRFEVQLDKGRIIVEGNKLKVRKYKMTEQEFSATNKNPYDTVEFDDIEVETDGLNLQHVGVLNAWASAILRGEPLVADGKEGIFGLTLSNAMHLSSWLNKEIEIPFDEDLFEAELKKRVANSKAKDVHGSVFTDTSNSYNV